MEKTLQERFTVRCKVEQQELGLAHGMKVFWRRWTNDPVGFYTDPRVGPSQVSYFDTPRLQPFVQLFEQWLWKRTECLQAINIHRLKLFPVVCCQGFPREKSNRV